MPMPPVDHNSAATAISRSPRRRSVCGADILVCRHYGWPDTNVWPTSIRQNRSPIHPLADLALRRRTWKRIVRRRHEERALADHFSERVDLDWFVQNGHDRLRVDVALRLRITNGDDEGRRVRPLPMEV